MSNILKEPEAASYLALRPDTLRAWRCRNKGPKFIKLDGAIRYRLEDLQAYLEEKTVEPSKAEF